MNVNTVSGPIHVDELGITLTHEHLLIDLYRVTSIGDHLLDDPELAVQELAPFRALGGGSLVDLTSEGLRRDPLALRQISQRSGVHIIMGSGWYREPFYPPTIYTRSTNTLADYLVDEIENGVGGTGIRPGVLGEIGTEKDRFTPAMERVFRAVARAHCRTGLPIFTHATAGTLGLEQLDLLREEGVDLRWVVIGHADGRMDHNYHTAIARAGAYVGFDRIGRPLIGPPSRHIAALQSLADQGLLDHVLLSQNVSLKSHLHYYGGLGYDYILSDFVPLLRDAGFSQEQIDLLLIENPKRLLGS